MNKHLTQIRKHVLNHIGKTEVKTDMIKELKEKYANGDLARNDYKLQIQELKDNTQDGLKAIQDINKAAEAFQAELSEWATLDGKDLTDDVNLLNSPIELNPDDYEKLETKYQCNYSMLKAIKDHATKNEIKYTSKYSVNSDEKAKAFHDYIETATNIINVTKVSEFPNYTGALWGNDEAYTKLYADTSKFLQTNEGERKLIHGDGTHSWG